MMDPAGENTDTSRVRGLYEDRYLSSGYMHSGSDGPQRVSHKTGLGLDRTLAAIESLITGGVLRRRDCPAWSYELTPAERARLIDAHGLRGRWEAEAPYFYPNHPQYGEIPRVFRQAADAAAPPAPPA
jgi:hypothetical protein